MKKILIIEDDLIVRSIYRRKFEMSGYKVETAEEGTAALAMLPVFKPDVIQVDIMLPGIDGVEVIRQIRAWPEFRGVPILVLSSFYRPDLAKEAWKAGATKCVSKMDCTPNLALELIEQLLSGEATSFTRKPGTIALPKAALASLEAPPEPAAPAAPTISMAPAAPASKPAMRQESVPFVPVTPPPRPALPKKAAPVEAPPPWPEDPNAPEAAPKLKVSLDLPPSKGAAPTRPAFAEEKSSGPAAEAPRATVPRPEIPAPRTPTRPTFAAAPAPAAPPAAEAPPAPAEAGSAIPDAPSGSDFRIEIRNEFLRRAPQIQAELRERVGALIKSKSTTDQFNLLHDLEATVSSLASLAGITGFGRVAHLSGSLDALIKDLNKKPSQMTASVLRTIAHAADCMNVLFRDLNQVPKELPQSILILAVDDEPIARRTISVALSKANLRCVGMDDSRAALNLLKENPFDLIFLDAEMPGLTGFELCAELRKLPTNKTTPVIFVTSLTKFEVRAQSSLSGGNDLIAKPFLMMELAVKALTYLLKPAPTVETKTKPAVAE
jgi:CheY-like chemotaxis protein